MTNPFITKKVVEKAYPLPEVNLYSQRFFTDLSSFLSVLCNKDHLRGSFVFEPQGCIAEQLLWENSNYELVETIQQVMYSLLAYGKAYIYLKANDGQTSSTEKEISSLNMNEIKGIIKRKSKDTCTMYIKSFPNSITECELLTDSLISMSINDLGYRKNHFSKLVKKLGTCDVLSSGDLICGDIEGYDFNFHLKKKKLKLLKVTKSIGWSFRNDDLTDSYILYRKILLDKFKLKALEYIINKINIGISTCLHNEHAGKLVAKTKDIDYDNSWAQFSRGDITASELAHLLYS